MTGYNKQLIIGLDPGTTTAYAVLTMHGQILKIRSSKLLKLDKVIEEVHQNGIPLIVGTDRSKCPGMVRKFAAKTGAVKAVPDYDLPELEKNQMTRGIETANAHQKDALASALVAYKKYLPLLMRIDKTLAKEGKTELAEQVKHIVITQKISIKKAVELIEKSLPLVSSY